MEILSFHGTLYGKIFPCNPLPIQEKNFPENVCTLPNNHYYMYTPVKVCNL